MENAEGKCFTSGCNESKRQLDAREELNRRPRERHPGLVVILQVREGEEKGETLTRQSSSKRDAEGFPSEKAAEAGYTAVAKRTLEAFAARRSFWNSWRTRR